MVASQFFTYCCFSAVILMLSGCERESPQQSEMFDRLFPDEELMFRNMELGFSTDTIKQLELQPPKHEDLLGLTYEYDFDEVQLFIEYYTDNLSTQRRGDRVVSVVANVLVGDEIKSSELYLEIREFFQRRYGPSSGTFGSDSWKGEVKTGSIEILMKLDDQRNGVTVNFLEVK